MLSPPECEALAQLAEFKGTGPGSIGNGADDGTAVVSDYRKVQTVGLLPDDRVGLSDIGWLFERVRDKVLWAIGAGVLMLAVKVLFFAASHGMNP